MRRAVASHVVLLLLPAAYGQGPPMVTITDTIRTPFNELFRGRVSITLKYSGPMSAGSSTLAAGFIRLDVINGAFSVSLVPNSAISPPGTSYNVRYTASNGYSWDETWVVPATPPVNTIANVRVSTVPSPLTIIAPQQISTQGASSGQVLMYNGSTVTWGTISGGGGGGGGVAWGGITGTLSDQTDLWNALSGKASVSHTHTLSQIQQSGASVGQVPQWNGSAWVPATIAGGGDSLWSSGSGGAIYYNLGNVGIGTAAPSNRLDVAAGASSGISVTSSSDSSLFAVLRRGSTSFGELLLYNNGNLATALRGSGDSIISGNLGIGKSPTSALDVNGTVKATALEGPLNWSYITNTPSTYPPSTHGHSASDITSGTISTARLGGGTASSSTFLRGDQTWASVTWNNVANKPSAYPPESHVHSAADITSGTISTAQLGSGTASSSTFLRGDQTWASVGWGDIAGKPTVFPPQTHTHSGADITSGTVSAARLGSGTASSGTFLRGDQTWASVTWDNVANKPSAYPPESHVHSASDITSGTVATARLGGGTASSSTFLRGDQTWAAVTWDNVTNKPSSYPPESHVHSASDITTGTIATARLGGGTASSSTFLRGDQTWAAPPVTSVFGRTGAITASAGDYTASQISNVPAGNIAATTVQAAINELDSEKSPIGHGHVIADVSGLQTALDGKANSTHTHAVSDLTQSGATTGQVLGWNGASWAPLTVSSAQPNYSQSFTNQTSVSITHNSGTTDVIVSCYDSNGVEIIPQSVTLTSSSAVTVTFGQSTSGKCVVNRSSGGGVGGSGTVTSVGLSMPSGFTVSGSPVTTSGTLTVTTSLNGVVRATNGGFTVVTGNSSDCVRVDGTSGACGSGSTVNTGTGLIGDGTQANPVRIDPNSGIATQLYVFGTVDFPSIGGGTCAEQSLTGDGLSPSMAVAPAWPASIPAGLVGIMYTGANVLVVRLCNVTGTAIDPPSLTYGARVIGGF